MEHGRQSRQHLRMEHEEQEWITRSRKAANATDTENEINLCHGSGGGFVSSGDRSYERRFSKSRCGSRCAGKDDPSANMTRDFLFFIVLDSIVASFTGRREQDTAQRIRQGTGASTGFEGGRNFRPAFDPTGHRREHRHRKRQRTNSTTKRRRVLVSGICLQ